MKKGAIVNVSSSSSSRLPIPPVTDGRPSASPQDSSSSGLHQRAKFVVAHGPIVQNGAARNRASTPERVSQKDSSGAFPSREYDSANIRAAKELRCLREAAGLTQEEAAELCGADPKTIRQRENGAVDLGALKQRLRLVEAAREKYLADEASTEWPGKGKV